MFNGKKFRELFGHVQGHLAYEILKWVVVGLGAIMTPVLLRLYQQYVEHVPPENLLGYLLLGVGIACLLLLLLIVVKAEWKARDVATSVPSKEPASGLQTDVIAVPPNKGVDLHGVVENLYFTQPLSSAGIYLGYSVYMKLRITNHGPDDGVVTKWHLYIKIGDENVAQGASVPIKPNVAIKRPDPNTMFIQSNFVYESVQPDLAALPPHDAYRKGIPKIGWLRFDPADYGSAPPHNGELYIALEDSFGDVHWVIRKPQSLRVDGELVELPEKPKELGSGS